MAIWQLGEFKEARAIPVLERLAADGPPMRPGVEFEHLPRLAKEARLALEKVAGQREPELRRD